MTVRSLLLSWRRRWDRIPYVTRDGASLTPPPSSSRSRASDRAFLSLEGLEKREVPAGSVSGIAFRDYNANGTQDTREPGVGGIAVAAFDPNNTLVASTTTSSAAATLGQYSLTLAGAATRYRIEFSGLPSYLQPGAFGPQSGTTVQFIDTTTGTATASLGVNNPADYSQPLAELQYLATCYVTGNQMFNADGSPNTADVLVAFPATARGNAIQPTHIASANQIGTTYGLAYQRESKTVFAAALMKRHSGFGPSGTGAIYRIDMSTAIPTVSTLLDLNTLGGLFAAGSDPHPTANGTYNPNQVNGGGSPWFRDITPGDTDGQRGFDAVSKISLGDMDISEDGRTLFVVNLNTRELIQIPINAAGQLDNTRQVARTAIPLTTANDARNFNHPEDIRPFGLGVKDGLVYVGSVYTAQTEAAAVADPRTLRDHLQAYVYTFDPTQPAGSQFSTNPVLQFNLNYPRGSGDIEGNTPSATDPRADWLPWTNTFQGQPGQQFPELPVYAQPILSDITFDNGDLILGMRDRFGDQVGYFSGSPNPADPTKYQVLSAGDILRAGNNGNGTWTIENNGTVNGVVSGGTNTGAGPGGGEYYYNDQVLRDVSTNPGLLNTFGHQEITLGSVLQVPGARQVAASAYDSYAGFTGGVLWFDNAPSAGRQAGQNDEGDITITQRPLPLGITPSYDIGVGGSGDRYELFQTTSSAAGSLANPPTISKASGLGDFDAAFAVAPLEIGNRVWLDSNSNGLQDADEPGIGGVSVQLLDASNAVVATKTTDSQGLYLFTDADVPGGLSRNSTYRVSLTLSQAALTGFTLTTANAGTNDSIDSDATASAGAALVLVPTSTDGHNDHTFDIGFVGSIPTMSLGNRVFEDTDNNGLQGNGELGIANVTVRLFRDSNNDGTPDGAALLSTSTNTGGYYLFTNLTPDTYIVEVVTPSGYTTSTGTPGSATGPYEPAPDPDNDVDLDDNGSATGTVVRSAPVTLSVNSEPINEAVSVGLTDPATDNNSNLTVDFGFFRLPANLSLGNLVFNDLNNDGFRQANEPGIPNVTVRLLDSANALLATTTTGPNGTYLFSNLAEGSYRVEVVRPTGFVSSTGARSFTDGPFEPAPSPENNLDNDDNGTSSGAVTRSSAVQLTLGQEPTNDGDTDANSNLTVDFGFFEPACLSGNVTFDANRNRVRDVGESPIPGVIITLRDQDGVVVARQTTNANGDYKFTNLVPGTYAVYETQPSTYSDGADKLGSHGGVLGNDQMTQIVLSGGAVAVGYDFLEVRGIINNDEIPPSQRSRILSKLGLLASTVTSQGLADAENFVNKLYIDVLGRVADQNGFDGWVVQILTGTSRATVARAFWNSDEARVLQLDGYYRQFLRRSIDDGGRTHFLEAFRRGATEIDVIQQLVTSAEYLTLHPGTEGFLVGLYEDLLGRGLDDNGRAFWLPQLANPANWANVARTLATCPESTGRMVSGLYGDLLHRQADPNGRQFWANFLTTGQGRLGDVAVALLSSEEYLRRS